jgi:hypothetical protein
MWWRLPDYHTPSDTIDKVEMPKLEATVDAAFRLLRTMT